MWDRIIGQERVKSFLRASIERGRIAHAYLFYGDEGVGMDGMAIEFARVLNCQEGKTEACGSCPPCKQFDKLQHPNLKLVYALPRGRSERNDQSPILALQEKEIRIIQEELSLKAKNPYHQIQIPKGNEIRINSIRELRRDAALTAFAAGRKVYILFDAERMNDEASNALLKTLEEPTSNTLLILTTSKRERLLPTILSRCQAVKFDPLSSDQIKNALVHQYSISPERAQLIATVANGNFSRALDLLDTDLDKRRDEVVSFIRNSLSKKRIELFKQIEELTETLNRDGVEQWLSLMLIWLRDTEALQEGNSTGLVNVDQSKLLESFVANFPHADHAQAILRVDEAIALVGRNVYIPLVLANLAYQLRDAIAQVRKESFAETRDL